MPNKCSVSQLPPTISEQGPDSAIPWGRAQDRIDPRSHLHTPAAGGESEHLRGSQEQVGLWAAGAEVCRRAAAERKGDHQGRSRTRGSLLPRTGCREQGAPVPKGTLQSTKSTQAGDRSPEHRAACGHCRNARGRTSEPGPRPQGQGRGPKVRVC